MEIYSTVQRPLREIPLRKINPDGRDDGGGRDREREYQTVLCIIISYPSFSTPRIPSACSHENLFVSPSSVRV